MTSARELRLILRALERMIHGIDTGRPIEPPGFWRPITDTWPLDSKLGEKILNAELLYEKLLQRYPG